MDVSRIAQFAVLVGGLTLLPGADSAIVLRAGVVGGRSTAFRTSIGVVAGLFVWGAAVALAVATAAAALPELLQWLKWVGVGYLLWLAMSLLRNANAGENPQGTGAEIGFKQGLFTNLLNPKIAIFYLATIPLFLPAGIPPVLGGLLLAAIHGIESLLWLGLLGWFGASLGNRANPRTTALIDRIVALLLIGFAIALALH